MAVRQFAEELPPALDGQRVDRVVALVGHVSRSQAAALISAGGVAIDGEVVDKPSLRVSTGNVVVFEVDGGDTAGPLPDPAVSVPVVHIDEHLIVVDKPAGLVVHPGSGVVGATMVNGLLARYPDLADVGDPDRPGVVHRLDKGTSGLLMVARNTAAFTNLSAQLRRRRVEREYHALVHGHVAAEGGVVDAPVGRSPDDRTRQAVVAGGRTARTHYEVVRRTTVPGTLTTLFCRLETGRTHQIRVHLSAIGHPVVGDPIYRGSGNADHGLERQFLHARSLGFEHPVTGRPMRFESPLPSDLATLDAELH